MSDNESIIWGLIRSHQDKKARKRMMESIAIENENNKIHTYSNNILNDCIFTNVKFCK